MKIGDTITFHQDGSPTQAILLGVNHSPPVTLWALDAVDPSKGYRLSEDDLEYPLSVARAHHARNGHDESAAHEPKSPGRVAADACAAFHLGVDILDERGSDRLDFHDLGVVSIRHALEAAFILGQHSRPK